MLYFLSVRISLELLWNLFLNFPQRANLLLTFIEAWNPGVWKPKFDHKHTFSLGPGVVALSASLKKTSLVLMCFHFGRSCFVYTYPNLILGSISTLVSRMIHPWERHPKPIPDINLEPIPSLHLRDKSASLFMAGTILWSLPPARYILPMISLVFLIGKSKEKMDYHYLSVLLLLLLLFLLNHPVASFVSILSTKITNISRIPY